MSYVSVMDAGAAPPDPAPRRTWTTTEIQVDKIGQGQVARPTLDSLDPDTDVAEGTEVTAEGTGFVAGAKVSVDGADPLDPADVSVVDGTELTFDAPIIGEEVTVPVTIITGGGESNPVDITGPDSEE